MPNAYFRGNDFNSVAESMNLIQRLKHFYSLELGLQHAKGKI